MNKLVRNCLDVLIRGVSWATVLALGWMGLLAGVQVILRLTFNLNVPWVDIQLRQLVLVVGMGGGIIAAAEFRHIRIDLIQHWVPAWSSNHLRRLMAGLSAIGAGVLSVVSVKFVLFEQDSGSVLRGILFGLSIPNWWTELIVPLGFALMTIFFIGEALLSREHQSLSYISGTGATTSVGGDD